MTENLAIDGRTARRERNQSTVLDAVIELFESGIDDPAVDDVSAWCGVSTRSIYRYFHHHDGLIAAALCHLVSRVDHEMPLQLGNGSLMERIERFVAHRLDVHRRVAPLTRAVRRTSSSVDSPLDTVWGRDALAARSVFTHTAVACFAADFAVLPSVQRREAEAAAEMALQFESLEFLTRAFDGDRASVASVLIRQLGQQFETVY